MLKQTKPQPPDAYILKVSKYHPLFIQRSQKMFHLNENLTVRLIAENPNPDLIICDGCNAKITTDEFFLLYGGPKGQKRVIRCLCQECIDEFYYALQLIDETELNLIHSIFKKLSPRERNFVLNFFSTIINNKESDYENYRYDLQVYQYKQRDQLIYLFDFLYQNDDLLSELSRIHEQGGEN